MKRIIALVSLLICMALMLGSCSLTNMSFREYYRKYDFEAMPELNSNTYLSELDAHSYNTTRSSGDMLVFTSSDGSEAKFYNAKEERVVLTLQTENLIEYAAFNVMGYPFIFTASEEDTDATPDVTTRVYDAAGEVVATATNPASTSKPQVACDVFKFDDKLYRVDKDGEYEMVGEGIFSTYLPYVDYKTKNYYYEVDDDEVSVYNKKFECVMFWEVPFEEYEDSEIFLLSDGVLLAQVYELLPDDAEEYSYIADGEKINLVSYILDAGKNKAKEVELDYIVDYAVSTDMILDYTEDYFEDMPGRLNNRADVYYINNRRVDSRETSVNIRSNGSVFEITPKYDSLPSPVAENLFSVTYHNGEKHLINAKGKVIANVTGMNYSVNENFIVVGNKVYDFELDLVYDAEADGKVFERVLATAVLFKSENANQDGSYTYTLYTADDNKVPIEDYHSANNQFYVTKSFSDEINFYSNTGSLILSVNGNSWDTIYTSYDSDVKIISVTDSEGNNRFYKLSVE